MKQTSWIMEKSKSTPLEIYENLEKEIRKSNDKWKFFAIISICGFALSLLCMVWALNLPKSVPVIVSVSDFGEAKYVGEINKINYTGMNVPEVAIQYQIRKLVTNMYTIPGDAEVLRNNLLDCYSCLTRESASKFSDSLKAHNPLNDVKDIRKKVEVESILKTSKNSYQIDFIVTQTNPYGNNSKTQRMRGLVTLIFLEPNDKDKILNPLGIYFSDYDFTELNTK